VKRYSTKYDIFIDTRRDSILACHSRFPNFTMMAKFQAQV
jgi:hypothetical protein